MNESDQVKDTQAKADQAKDEAEIISIAVRLLAAGVPSEPGPGQVDSAVRASRALINEVRQSRSHPCNVFDSAAIMSMEDMAEHFKEHDIRKLTSTASVTRRVLKILIALHRDIQRRENLITAAFRQFASRINADDAELESKRLIRVLLERTRLSLAFDRHCEEVVSAVWQFLIERFLMQERRTRAQIESTRNHTREYFELICTDMKYDQFTAGLAPPENLKADQMLDLIIWLEERFATHLRTRSIDQDDLVRLEAINRWPAFIYPNDSILSRPFAVFLAEYTAGDDGTEEHAVRFHDGLQRLSELEQRIRISELAGRWINYGSIGEQDGRHETSGPSANSGADTVDDPAAIKATAESILTDSAGGSADGGQERWGGVNDWQMLDWLRGLRSEWRRLDQETRSSMAERFFIDPENLVAQAERFLSDGRILLLGAQPFDGNQVKNPLLRNHARNLQVLSRCLRELQRFAEAVGRPADVTESLLRFLKREIEGWNEIDGSISHKESPERKRRLDSGQKTFDGVKCLDASAIGKVRPHLLFRYASDSGLL